MTVRIKDIVDALEMQSEEYGVYLDRDTGEVEAVEFTLLRRAEEAEADEEAPEMPEWQRPQWTAARKIVSTDRMLPLPDKFDIHEWDVMREFAESLKSEKVRRSLLDAVHGERAFRRFKDAIHRLGVQEAWYAFREAALKQIAIDWCKENELPYE